MNQGCLKLLVVQRLMREPSSGYALAKSIQEQTGWKPSWGSIYPLLASLQREELLDVRSSGKSKIYSLTTKGKVRFSKQDEQMRHAHRNIIEQLRVLASLGDTEAGIMAEILHHSLAQERLPFQEIPEAHELRNLIYEHERSGKTHSETKSIRAVLRRAVKELKAI